MKLAREIHTLIRHDETAHQARQIAKMDYPVYRAFRKAYDRNKDSETTRRLANEVAQTISSDYGEYNIPLLDEKDGQISRAQRAAQKLMSLIPLPDVIYVSPTSRTIKSLERMIKGWPDLRNADIRVENLIRERDLGLAWLFCDIKVFEALNPEEAERKRVSGDYHYSYPSGESVVDVRNRVARWSEKLEQEGAPHVLSVGHRVNILAFRANQEGLDETGYMALDGSFKLADSGTTVYLREQSDSDLVLHKFNIPVQKLEKEL